MRKSASGLRISVWIADVCSSDLRRAFRPFRQSGLTRQSAPVGESTNLRIPVAAIVGRHIIRPLARQRSDKPAIVAEVVAAVMELHAVSVPRRRHIGRMAVPTGGRPDMRAIDRHALRFMESGCIADIGMGIIYQVKDYR